MSQNVREKQENKSDCWQTPQWLFQQLDKEFHFDIDVCADKWNRKFSKFFSTEHDCLHQEWTINKQPISCFMNPPYSCPKPYIEKALQESEKGCTVICLLKVDTSTRWWALFWDYEKHQPRLGIEVRFLPKRIKFDSPYNFTGKKTSAAFASCIVVMKLWSRS